MKISHVETFALIFICSRIPLFVYDGHRTKYMYIGQAGATPLVMVDESYALSIHSNVWGLSVFVSFRFASFRFHSLFYKKAVSNTHHKNHSVRRYHIQVFKAACAGYSH